MMPASTKRHGKLLLLLFLIMMHTRALFGFEYAKLRWRAFNCNYYTYSRFSTLWATGGMERLRTDRNAATALKSTVHMASYGYATDGTQSRHCSCTLRCNQFVVYFVNPTPMPVHCGHFVKIIQCA